MSDKMPDNLLKYISVVDFIHQDIKFQVLFVFGIPRAIICGYSCFLVFPPCG